MILNINENTKQNVFDDIMKALWAHDLPHLMMNIEKPWGGYCTFPDNVIDKFCNLFFSGIDINEILHQKNMQLSPKILVVEPSCRLSWQYHHRRSELWRCIYNQVGVVLSDTDEETECEILSEGDHVVIGQGQRHRLVGLDKYGVIAELWQHVDPENPSNEQDIIRVSDDFGR